MKATKQYRVRPGHKLRWEDVNSGDTGPFDKKEEALDKTEESIQQIDLLQERLFAEGTRGLLIVLQGIDTSGKDGTIRHVMRGLNPQGCRVTSFKEPTPEELGHDFLWRVHRHVPAKGVIGIFNRSHYEDVLVTRVHDLITGREAEKRFRVINDFERILAENGTVVVKFFLAISKEEQRRRLQARLDDPQKRWKFSPNDLAERGYWDRYMKAYSEAISATSTKRAPWYLIPANHEWYRNYLVAKIIAATLGEMDPKYPADRSGIDTRKIVIPN